MFIKSANGFVVFIIMENEFKNIPQSLLNYVREKYGKDVMLFGLYLGKEIAYTTYEKNANPMNPSAGGLPRIFVVRNNEPIELEYGSYYDVTPI